MVTLPMTSRDPQRCCEAIRSVGYPSDSLASCLVSRQKIWC